MWGDKLKQRIMKIALEGMGAVSPIRLVEYVVASDNPVSIRVGNDIRTTLPSSVLIITERLTNHTKQVRVNGVVQTHEFMNGLKKGEKVMVAVVQGGQSFFIIDRV